MFIVTWLELSISFTGEFSVREFSAGKFSGYHFQEPAKLRALRAPVPTCLTWLRAHVPTCLACLCAHVPTWLACLRAHVPTCQRALRALRGYVLTCYNYRQQKYVFNNMFSLHFCHCSLWNKTVVHSCISLTRRKPLTGAMINIVQ